MNWIQKYIFPGGVLPSLAEMERANAKTGLVVASVDNIGLDYAVTLRQWRAAFWNNVDRVRNLTGYDERFIKTWDYYLAACEAGFLSHNTDDVQIVFEKPAIVLNLAPVRTADSPSARFATSHRLRTVALGIRARHRSSWPRLLAVRQECPLEENTR